MKTLHITNHDTAHKLAGIQSLSTSVVVNPICQARRKVNSTCASCFADSILRYRKNLDNLLIDNFNVLNGVMTEEEIAAVKFTTLYARIESFGDCASYTQAYNYVRIINNNPLVQFAIWTKNYAFYFRVFDAIGKPENVTFVLSSPNVNEVFDISRIPEKWRGYIDHVFTVYDPDKYPVNDEGLKGHCAGVRCMDCLKCYKRGTTFYISEALRTRARANIQGRADLAQRVADYMEGGRV